MNHGPRKHVESSASSSSVVLAKNVGDVFKKVDHTARIKLEKPYGEVYCYIIDTVLLQRYQLPVGIQWELEWDDGWVAAVDVASPDPQIVVVEDVLPKELWQGPGGELATSLLADTRTRMIPFTEKLQKHQSGIMHFKVGPLRSASVLDVFVATWPRGGGCRFLWSLLSVYKVLGITSFKGQGSKWAYHGFKSWAARVGDCVVGGQHIFHGRLSTGVGSKAFDPIEQFLPHPSVTTFALLVLLSTWTAASSQRGGFRDNASRLAARTLLDGLLKSACMWQPCRIMLRITDTWLCPWPCRDDTAVDVRLEVSADGSVIATPLFDCECSGYRHIVHKRWVELFRQCLHHPRDVAVHITDILCASVAAPDSSSLYRQLVWGMCKHLDGCAFKSFNATRPHLDAVYCVYVDIMQLLWNPKTLDHQLYRHVLAGIEASNGHRDFSLAFDKANVGGLTLANSFIAMPDNTGFPGVPQVISPHRQSFF